MTQEEKDLVWKDLCARLPYGVIIQEYDEEHGYSDNTLNTIDIGYFSIHEASIEGTWINHIENVKPYLRPVSSMTEEEMDKLFDILHIDKDGRDDDWIKINDDLGIKFFFPTGKWIENVAEAYDYLNSIHIDYRGLIPVGLALEAPENMYKQ